LEPFSQEAFSQTYPMLLKAAGYYTGYIGKWGVGSTRLPALSFDYWGGFEHQGVYFEPGGRGDGVHSTRKIGGQALEFLRSRDERKPFVLSIGFKAPHVQDNAPPDPEKIFPADPAYADVYEDVAWTRPAAADERHFQHFPAVFTERNEARNRWRHRFSTPARYDASLEGYYRLVHGVDVVVGELLHELERQGIADDTVILFSSDNGFYLGEYGFAGKWYGSEPSVRVPLILFDPREGAARGRRVSKIALNIDIAPTLLSLAGVSRPEAMQGRDLMQAVSGTAESWRSDFFYENLWPASARPYIPSTEGVIAGRYKYMRYFSSRRPDEVIFEEMYDLKHDPGELSNLIDAADSREQRSRLVKAVLAFREELK
jgi:arylsulfatase A-like enzyme